VKYLLTQHKSKRQFTRPLNDATKEEQEQPTIMPFPTNENLEQDLKEMEEEGLFEKCEESLPESDNKEEDDDDEPKTSTRQHLRPGGNMVWGCYGYWMSRQAYESLMDELRNDVGALLWKGKRMRYYSVKPIDKVLPRRTIAIYGADSVHLATHPAVFRAPMLTSKIHTQWDPEFCKSTQVQLEHCDLDWNDLWLTESERQVVEHYKLTGKWITPAQLSTP
jgi:hypothetical protein